MFGASSRLRRMRAIYPSSRIGEYFDLGTVTVFDYDTDHTMQDPMRGGLYNRPEEAV
jgi:hypothetical protein